MVYSGSERGAKELSESCPARAANLFYLLSSRISPTKQHQSNLCLPTTTNPQGISCRRSTTKAVRNALQAYRSADLAKCIYSCCFHPFPARGIMSDASSRTSSTDAGSKAAPAPAPAAAKPVRDDAEESARLCRKWVESGITGNDSIQFLLKTLMDLGCTPPDKFIRCVNCEQPAAGGFGMVVEESLGRSKRNNNNSSSSSTAQTNNKEQCQRTMRDLQEQIEREKEGKSRLKLAPEIFVCQQYQDSELMTHKTVHHELIHAIDMCRSNADPLHNCVQMACTEIRAENLSGECGFWKELPRLMQSKFAGHGRECVKRRAVLSVRANPNCKARAEEYVDLALPRCMQDFYPYDKHPNQR